MSISSSLRSSTAWPYTLRATATASEQYYVFAPREMAPRNLFGLQVRVEDGSGPVRR